MKPTYCSLFSDGMNDGLVAECWQERVALWLLALLKPTKYRLGLANGAFCIWWKRTAEGKTGP